MGRLLLMSAAMLALTTASVLAQQTPKPIPEQAEHQVRAESLLGVDVSNGSDTIGEGPFPTVLSPAAI